MADDNEIELLKRIALAVLEAYDCDDLWIDGFNGATSLSEARDLADEWKSKYTITTDTLVSKQSTLRNAFSERLNGQRE